LHDDKDRKKSPPVISQAAISAARIDRRYARVVAVDGSLEALGNLCAGEWFSLSPRERAGVRGNLAFDRSLGWYW